MPERKPKPTKSKEPHDRLTRICAAMTEAMDAHPEHNSDTDKAIVFLDDGRVGGIQIHGNYKDDAEALVDLIMHIKAIFESRGQVFEMHFIGDRSMS